jgi:predicted RNase H-like HicB family nuclease
MRYPIAIEPGDANHAFGVVFPDLPGCFSAGDTLDEAIDNAHEAAQLWLETIIDDGGSIPPARAISEHYTNPDFSGWIWALVSIDLSTLPETSPR